LRAEVRVRYRHTPAHATIKPLPLGRAHIKFDEPQRAITPGQATVFYRGDEVAGGGWIVKTEVRTQDTGFRTQNEEGATAFDSES
jgi:tRNA-specific 2-thiouridylase